MLTAGTPGLSVTHYPGVRDLQSLPVGGRCRQMVARVESVEKQWAEAVDNHLLLEKNNP